MERGPGTSISEYTETLFTYVLSEYVWFIFAACVAAVSFWFLGEIAGFIVVTVIGFAIDRHCAKFFCQKCGQKNTYLELERHYDSKGSQKSNA